MRSAYIVKHLFITWAMTGPRRQESEMQERPKLEIGILVASAEHWQLQPKG